MSSGDDGVCAICLKIPHALDVAFVKSCLHSFCAPCVARWSTFTKTSERFTKCPCCKAPFDAVLVYRALNGEVIEGELMEESLCLLNRATWVLERRNADWDDGQHERSSEEEEEEYCDFGDSFQTSRKTLVIGNRRFGRGGFVNSGRQYARPIAQKRAVAGKGKDVVGSSSSPTCSKGKPPKGASSATSSPVNIPSSRPSRSGGASVSPSSFGGGTVSSDSEIDSSSPRDNSSSARGKKSAKRQESLAKKREKEQSKAASRLKRREEEHAAEEARKAAKALEALALENDDASAQACVVGE